MTDLRDTSRDERLLAAHGYRQELERGLSLWSSFSVGFATISPVVGIYSVMSLGAMSMGPSWVWVVPLCLLLQFGVALVYAELSSQFPLAGGCYQWVRRLVGDRLAWFTGFLYLASALASLTTVAYLGGFWLGLLATGAPPSANGQVLCGALLLALGLAVNLLGINPLKYFVNAGIVAEAIASIGIGVLLLLFFRNHPLDLLFSGPGGTGGADGAYLDGVLTALAVGGWAFLGFDACSQISEETTDARVSTPRAILRSTACALWARLVGRWDPDKGALRLGRAGLAVNVLAVAWLSFEALNVAWPRASLAPPDAPWFQVWAVVVVFSALAAFGLLYMVIAKPHRRIATSLSFAAPPAD